MTLRRPDNLRPASALPAAGASFVAVTNGPLTTDTINPETLRGARPAFPKGEQAGRVGTMSLGLCSESDSLIGTALCFEFTDMGADSRPPEWIQFLPAGKVIKAHDGRIWNNPDPAALVTAFNRDGRKIPIDYEHATSIKAEQGEPAPATGWIDRMELRAGAVWAHIETWTATAAEQIRKKEYRYISPAFNFGKEDRVISSFHSAGLTNKPALDLTALCRTGTGTAGSENQNEKEPAMKELLIALCTLFEIDPNAATSTPDFIVGKVRDLIKTQADTALALNRLKTPDPKEFVPKAEFDRVNTAYCTLQAEVKKSGETKLDADINALIDSATKAGKLAPASKDWALGLCRSAGSVKPLEDFIATAPAVIKPSQTDGRDPAAQPGTGAHGLSETELAVCRNMGLKPEDYVKSAPATKAA